MFAVATLDSVLIYDTENLLPIAFVDGIHYAEITDLSWSVDGKTLLVSSKDGYCTVISFDDKELGDPIVKIQQ